MMTKHSAHRTCYKKEYVTHILDLVCAYQEEEEVNVAYMVLCSIIEIVTSIRNLNDLKRNI
jgi:hypothetical protein